MRTTLRASTKLRMTVEDKIGLIICKTGAVT